ncbi:hypothetical protein [Halocalculus aciditolerans]|uniref:Uncharacterized protein n=1 Tax=Halocalculus aciditolerans TaxID=1383812 RepID=A0A830FGI8_9EURY|nr:hypothetical protein [Halocalculus aciditolerans]GGL73320.1 hypothetical protein GCM10009039_34300 [Halocalculus aciditolerans]
MSTNDTTATQPITVNLEDRSTDTAAYQSELIHEEAEADRDDDILKDYDTLDVPDPIDHGHGINAVINDLDRDADAEGGRSFYERLFRYYQRNVDDRDAEPLVLVEDVHVRLDWLHDDYPAHLVLRSKGCEFNTADEDGNAKSQIYEYSLGIMRYEEGDDGEQTLDADATSNLRAPVSYQCWVRPQNEDLVYPSGDTTPAPYGEGTRFHVQTTYANSRESLVRTVHIMGLAAHALGIQKPAWETLDRDSWRIWKGEVHHRIDEKLMSAVVQRLREARSLLEYGGGGDVDGDGTMTEGRYVEEVVRSDRWDILGFNGYARRDGYDLAVKVYRLGPSVSDRRLRHPKIEAYLAGTNGDTELPHADEWAAIRGTLRQLASTFTVKAGVNLPKFIEDDYYKPMDRERVDTLIPAGWRQAVQQANDARMHRLRDVVYSAVGTKSKFDLLYAVAIMNGASYDELVDILGLTRDHIMKLVSDLEDEDILLRVTMPRIVIYNNEELRINALDELQAIHPDEDLRSIRARGEGRRENRQEQRRKNEQERQRADDHDEPEDAHRDTDADSGDTRASTGGDTDDTPSDSDAPATWQPFADVDMTGEQLGRALDRGFLDDTDVEVRTDPYPALFPR